MAALSRHCYLLRQVTRIGRSSSSLVRPRHDVAAAAVIVKPMSNSWLAAIFPAHYPKDWYVSKNGDECIVKLKAHPTWDPIIKTYLKTLVKAVGSKDEFSMIIKIYDILIENMFRKIEDKANKFWEIAEKSKDFKEVFSVSPVSAGSRSLLTKAAYNNEIYDEQSTYTAAGFFSSICNYNLSRQATISSLLPLQCLQLTDDATASIRPRSASISPWFARSFTTSSLSEPNPNLLTEETTSLHKRWVVGMRRPEGYPDISNSHIKTLTKVVGSKSPPHESNSSPPPESNSSPAPPGRKPTLKAAAILYLAYCTPFYLVHLMLKHFLWSDIEQSKDKRNNVAEKIEEMGREIEELKREIEVQRRSDV